MTSPFTPQANPLSLANPLFKLDYPQSLGVYTSYADAQKAVDSLADQSFPVANLAIVGTDLKLVERVTGRKTWGTVFAQGVSSGLSTSLMVALLIWFLNPDRDLLSIFLLALLIGVLIGVGFSALGHALSRGQRDFTSVSQTIPSKFEILCEHKVAAQARQLLSQTPDARAAAFDPSRYPVQPGQIPGPQGYPAPYPAQPLQPGQYPGQPGQYPAQSGQYPVQPGQYAGQPGPYDGRPGYPAPAAPQAPYPPQANPGSLTAPLQGPAYPTAQEPPVSGPDYNATRGGQQ